MRSMRRQYESIAGKMRRQQTEFQRCAKTYRSTGADSARSFAARLDEARTYVAGEMRQAMIDRERQKLVRKRQLRRVLKVHERQWAALETLRAEAAPVGSLALDDVPFPPDDTNPLCLRPGFSEDQKRQAFRTASLRYHPDKFMQRYGGLVHEEERQAVQERVQAAFVLSTRAWRSRTAMLD